MDHFTYIIRSLSPHYSLWDKEHSRTKLIFEARNKAQSEAVEELSKHRGKYLLLCWFDKSPIAGPVSEAALLIKCKAFALLVQETIWIKSKYEYIYACVFLLSQLCPILCDHM